jgi:hypothetical protein
MENLINSFLRVIIMGIIVVPVYIIYGKLKERDEKRNYIEEDEEEMDKFIQELKERNKK